MSASDRRILVVPNAEVGDKIDCPGCGIELYLDAMNGWRNDAAGYGCVGGTVHTDRILTIPKNMIR